VAKYLFFLIIFLALIGGVWFMSTTSKNETAIFAGGCFWCMQSAFSGLDGVKEVTSGYTAGEGKNPTYQDYAKKGYVEAIKVIYDPKKISYRQLLDTFWKNVDPTDTGGQFADRGAHYRTVIFYQNEDQKKEALSSKKRLQESGKFLKPIVTEIIASSDFYDAEDYHQNYAKKNKAAYKRYRDASGRDAFFKKIWGNTQEKKYKKPSDEELRKKLSSLSYAVTQENKTEAPFTNKYCDNKEPGIYVDIVSGEPLFISKDKFWSATGWPSFTQPLHPENIVEKEDNGRTEIRSKSADSHLGHVFKDGPAPTKLRYCINSSALRFIPVKDLKKEGYGKYLKFFKEEALPF